MSKQTAAERRFIENAALITALRLIFQPLYKSQTLILHLGEIAHTTSGGTPDRGSINYYGGDIPWIKSGELNDGLVDYAEEFITEEGLKNSSAKIYSKGSLLIALYGATVGKTGILGVEAASNQAVCAITPKVNFISTDFLFWFLRFKRQDFLEQSFGGAQPNISQKILRETDVPIPPLDIQDKICRFLEVVARRQAGNKSEELPTLPPPIDEQRRIVAKVEAIAAKIEEAKGLRVSAIEECNSLMSGKEIQLWDANSLKNSLPLQEVTTHLARGRQSKQGESNHYLIKTQHVQMGQYIRTKMTLSPEVFDKVSPEATAQYGDVLIACSAAGCLGRVAFYDQHDQVASTDTHVAIARANPKIVLPEYLYAYLRGAQGQFQIRSREKGDWTREKLGFRFTELNVSDMRRVPVPVPPISEQRSIVKHLDSLQTKVDEMKRTRQEALRELDAMLPSIIDRAFKGEL